MESSFDLIRRAYDIGSKRGIIPLLQKSWFYFDPIPASIVIHYYNRKYELLYDSMAPDPTKLIRVSPKRIIGSIHWFIKEYNIGPGVKLNSSLQRRGSFIMNGEWDQESPRGFSHIHDKYSIYRSSLYQRYREGYSWKETDVWEFAMSDQINDHRYENISQRCKELDRVFDSIKEKGYKTQRELGNKNSSYIDEVTVAITRSGDFLWLVNGFHRLHLAKILDLDSIPVRVGLRHKIWQRKRCFIDRNTNAGDVNADHPDILQS